MEKSPRSDQCLLPDVAKLLERVIVGRMTDWMEGSDDAALSKDQYGFVAGRSTCDALIRLREAAESAFNGGGVLLAIGLNIENAFNSVPWPTIRETMIRKEFPEYIRRIIDGYLYDRRVEYAISNGSETRPVTAGVPQGSVLGPLLWNIGYDRVLRGGIEYGCQVLCYADDTLILATADIVSMAVRRANLQIARTLDSINRVGVRVATRKTEAVLISRQRGTRSYPNIRVDLDIIRTNKSMKYLGVMIVERLSFREHFEKVTEKASKVSKALCRLMPNLRGPGEAKRRLYTNVILSVMLYAAPVWCDALKSSPKSQRIMNRVLRTTAIRVIAAYRTVALDAALLLARIPPLVIMVEERKRVYERVANLRAEGPVDKKITARIREYERDQTYDEWTAHLATPGLAGMRTVAAIGPMLKDWMTRGHGGLAFRLTQLLTGHGCFQAYLRRIQRTPAATCVMCDMGVEDTTEHTVSVCPRWQMERESLIRKVGRLSTGPRVTSTGDAANAQHEELADTEDPVLAIGPIIGADRGEAGSDQDLDLIDPVQPAVADLGLEQLVRKMLASRDAWIAVTEFSEAVIATKEAEERERQALNAPPPQQQRGRRRGKPPRNSADDDEDDV